MVHDPLTYGTGTGDRGSRRVAAPAATSLTASLIRKGAEAPTPARRSQQAAATRDPLLQVAAGPPPLQVAGAALQRGRSAAPPRLPHRNAGSPRLQVSLLNTLVTCYGGRGTFVTCNYDPLGIRRRAPVLTGAGQGHLPLSVDFGA